MTQRTRGGSSRSGRYTYYGRTQWVRLWFYHCYAYSATLTLAVLAMRRSGSLTLSLTLTLCVQEWFHNVKLGIAHQVKNMPKKERQVPYYSRRTKC